MWRGLELVQRPGQPFQSTVVREEVEMQRRPVRQQQGLVALPGVGLEVAATGLAVVDAQAGFSLDGHTGEPLSISFAERASGSLELPARTAAAAQEHTRAPGVGTDQLRHRR